MTMVETELPGQTVVGDGTSTASRVRSRWRSWRWLLVNLAVVAVAALVVVLPAPRFSAQPLAPDNATSDGGRALAQILGRQGVQVQHLSRLADVISAARPGTTLLVTNHYLLDFDHMDQIAATEADLVLLAPGWDIESYTDALYSSSWWSDEPTSRPANCPDPDAQAAGSLTWRGAGFAASDDRAVLCFAEENEFEPVAPFATVVEDGRRITALATPEVLSNGRLAEDGNAALALRILGRHRDLLWYVPDLSDLSTSSSDGVAPLSATPPWLGYLAGQLLVVVIVLALWRGRRLGRFVTEPLPVVVPSAEVTRGRGRLYRKSRSYGHAAAALRAAAATRMASRLGLPRSAGANDLVDEVARATGRAAQDVELLLYGRPPESDSGLTHLASQIDRLESEVHRP